MNNPQKLGKELEQAVKRIEGTILRSDGHHDRSDFTIESNKILVIDGVRHEIDIFVMIAREKSYNSIFIFECKYWKKPVGKKEIIDFSEKIKVTQAQKGFFIATKLSSSAKAQAVKDNRIEVVKARKDFKSPLDKMELQVSKSTFDSIDVYIKERDVEPKDVPDVLPWEKKDSYQNGKPINFEQYILDVVNTAIFNECNKNKTKYELEGNHKGRTKSIKTFSNRGDLIWGKMDIERLELDIPFYITVKIPRILSKFEIERRGRIFDYEPIVFEDIKKKLKIQTVQKI